LPPGLARLLLEASKVLGHADARVTEYPLPGTHD